MRAEDSYVNPETQVPGIAHASGGGEPADWKPVMRRCGAFRIAAALVLVLGCAACAGLPVGDPNDRLMTDDELIARFQSERASFDSLAVMVGEDRDSLAVQLGADRDICMIDGYGAHQARSDAASTARRNTYERLLRRVRVGRNVWCDTSRILFQQYVRKSGPKESRWMRGYVYARAPLDVKDKEIREGDLLADKTYLDEPYEFTTLYRHLDGSWYLFSDRGYTDD